MTLESHPPTSRDPIYLGTMLRLFASRIADFQKLLAKPKSVPKSILTTFGEIEPLGFERFRICELYAELLHCSNMALLNDPRGESIVHERDLERERLRKQGQAKPSSVNIWGGMELRNGKQFDSEGFALDTSDNGNSNESVSSEGPKIKEDRERQGSSYTIAPHDTRHGDGNATSEVQLEDFSDKFKNVKLDPESNDPSLFHNMLHSTTAKQKIEGRENTFLGTSEGLRPVVGDYLKMQFVNAGVLSSVVDLFFLHPWNNFLHNVVYDILTQVLNGPMDKGFNLHLAMDLFTNGRLTEKILDGQKASDEAQ